MATVLCSHFEMFSLISIYLLLPKFCDNVNCRKSYCDSSGAPETLNNIPFGWFLIVDD